MDSLVNPTGANIQWSVEKDGATYAMDLSDWTMTVARSYSPRLAAIP